LGHLKLECCILYPHLAKAPTSTPIVVNVGDMAELFMHVDNLKLGHLYLAIKVGYKITNVMHDNVQINMCVDLSLYETG